MSDLREKALTLALSHTDSSENANEVGVLRRAEAYLKFLAVEPEKPVVRPPAPRPTTTAAAPKP